MKSLATRPPDQPIPKPNVHYIPLGAAKELLKAHDPEVLLSGPAGTGKSLACLYKLHFCATHVPGFRGLIVRKTRASLTETGLVAFERHVLPTEPSDVGRANRHVYRYPGGGEIIVGGMNNPDRIMSSDYDMIFVQEAIELVTDDWEKLTTRLRNGAMAYQQIIADTNPSYPTHWLKKRCDAGLTRLLYSTHEDNLSLFRHGRWTPKGISYIAKLDNLTGARKQRLRYGRWVQAEGIIYDTYDPAVNLIDWFKPPKDWPRFLSIDFGFTDPFVCQWWAVDHDGRLYLYREIYRTGRLVEDHAKDIKAGIAADGVRPQSIICDHDAEDRMTLERHLGMATRPAVKNISAGIQAVAARFKLAADGKPRLFLMRDALYNRDPELTDSARPHCTEAEIDGYAWSDTRQDMPADGNDHGLDAMRYMVFFRDQPTNRIAFRVF